MRHVESNQRHHSNIENNDVSQMALHSSSLQAAEVGTPEVV